MKEAFLEARKYGARSENLRSKNITNFRAFS